MKFSAVLGAFLLLAGAGQASTAATTSGVADRHAAEPAKSSSSPSNRAPDRPWLRSPRKTNSALPGQATPSQNPSSIAPHPSPANKRDAGRR